jgi:hypothetical protein
VPLLQPWQVPVVASQTSPVGQITLASQRVGQPWPPTVHDWHRPLAEQVWPIGHGLVAEHSEGQPVEPGWQLVWHTPLTQSSFAGQA